jgi:hypothetical protein
MTSDHGAGTPYRLMPECDDDEEDDAEDQGMYPGLAAIFAPVGGDPTRPWCKNEAQAPSLTTVVKSKAVALLFAVSELFEEN